MTLEEILTRLDQAFNVLVPVCGQVPDEVSPRTALALGETLGYLIRAKISLKRDNQRDRTMMFALALETLINELEAQTKQTRIAFERLDLEAIQTLAAKAGLAADALMREAASLNELAARNVFPDDQ
jgi:hypothetical protein